MKHLKKFNESKDLPIIDKGYMHECFINIIDNYDTDIEEYSDNSLDNNEFFDPNIWCITINLPHVSYKNNTWVEIDFDKDLIENTIKKSTAMCELFQEIKVSIEKAKIKYHNIKVLYSVEQELLNNNELEDAYITIEFEIKKNKK